MSKLQIPVVHKGITMTEIPNRIAVFFEIGNCYMMCDECHSPELWVDNWTDPNMDLFEVIDYIKSQKEKGADAVVFMGGCNSKGLGAEDFINGFVIPISIAGIDVGLYTAYMPVTVDSLRYLKWIKLGYYDKNKGGLDSPTTNQRFYERSEYGVWMDKTKEYFQKDVNHERTVSEYLL